MVRSFTPYARSFSVSGATTLNFINSDKTLLVMRTPAEPSRVMADTADSDMNDRLARAAADNRNVSADLVLLASSVSAATTSAVQYPPVSAVSIQGDVTCARTPAASLLSSSAA